LLYGERALRAGAEGYVMKHASIEQVMTAIRQVLLGKIYLSEEMSNRLLRKVTRGHSTTPGSDLDQLSDRELEVFQSIGEGRSTRQIATALRVSSSTVATHRAHIINKLKLESSRDVMRRAVEWVQSLGS